MVTWVLFLGIGLIIGVIAGLYFARLDDVSNKQKIALQQKLDQSEQELSAYKSQVTDHFLKTAALVNSMTESYKAVHEHLSLGATKLCGSEVSVEQLEMPATKRLQDASTPSSKQHPQEAEKKPAESVKISADQTNKDKEKRESAASAEAKPADFAEKTAELVAETSASLKTGENEVDTAKAQVIEPPSTPESLHVEEEDSSKSATLDSEQTAANLSRMVH